MFQFLQKKKKKKCIKSHFYRTFFYIIIFILTSWNYTILQHTVLQFTLYHEYEGLSSFTMQPIQTLLVLSKHTTSTLHQ